MNKLQPSGIVAAFAWLVLSFLALPAFAVPVLWLFGYWGSSVLCALAFIVSLAIVWLRRECSCSITTRISADRLPSLGRLRTARKAIAILKASIDQAQGALPPELPPPIFDAATAMRPQSPPRLHSGVGLHAALFTLMALAGVAHWYVLGHPSAAADVAVRIVSFALLGLAILTAIRQYKTDVPKLVQAMVYLFLAQYALSALSNFVASAVVSGILAARHATRIDMAAIQAYPVVLLINRISVISQLAIAAAGLVFIWRRKRGQAPPSLFAGGDQPQLG